LADVVLFSLQVALSIAAPWAIIHSDMRRLCPERLRRCWNEASFWSAIVVFGPLSLPVHFIRSRRSLWGLLLGVVWMAAAMASSAGL
jgi:hypothetical protein